MISKTIGYNGVLTIFRHTHMAWSNLQPLMLALLAKRDQALRHALCQLTVHDCLRSSTIDHDCPWNVSYIPIYTIYHINILYYIYIPYILYIPTYDIIRFFWFTVRSFWYRKQRSGWIRQKVAHFGCICKLFGTCLLVLTASTEIVGSAYMLSFLESRDSHMASRQTTKLMILIGCVWKWLVPHWTQWFWWSLSLWKMAISLNIPYFQTNPFFRSVCKSFCKLCQSC